MSKDLPAKPDIFSDKFLNPFRPLTSLQDARHAQLAGAGLGVFMIVGVIIGVVQAAMRSDDVPMFVLIGPALVAAICIALSAWVWTRRSLIATLLLIGLYVADRVAAAVLSGRVSLGFLSGILVFAACACAILAIRGHLAERRIAKTGLPDTEVFS